MTSYWFLFLAFCVPHLLCLVDTGTGSIVLTNETTILLIPTEKRVIFHVFKEAIGETYSFTGVKTEAATAAVGPGSSVVRKSVILIPAIVGIDTANMKTTSGNVGNVGNYNTAANGVAAAAAATAVASDGGSSSDGNESNIITDRNLLALRCCRSSDLNDITIHDVEDPVEDDKYKYRRKPDLETSCAFCLENMVYGSEVNELHSCTLHLDLLSHANCDQTTSLAFNKNIGNCNIIVTSVEALTETKKDKKYYDDATKDVVVSCTCQGCHTFLRFVFKILNQTDLVLAVFKYGSSICFISFISLVYFFVSGKKNKNLSNGQRLKTLGTINGHKTMNPFTSSVRMFSILFLLLQICSCAAQRRTAGSRSRSREKKSAGTVDIFPSPHSKQP